AVALGAQLLERLELPLGARDVRLDALVLRVDQQRAPPQVERGLELLVAERRAPGLDQRLDLGGARRAGALAPDTPLVGDQPAQPQLLALVGRLERIEPPELRERGLGRGEIAARAHVAVGVEQRGALRYRVARELLDVVEVRGVVGPQLEREAVVE